MDKPEAKPKASHLDALLSLNAKTKFSEKGEAKVDEDVIEPVADKPVKKEPGQSKSKTDIDVDAFPWMKEGLDQENAMLMLRLPSDFKLFLQRISRLIGDKESMTSVLMMCAEKELPGLAKKYNLPLPKSLKK